MMVGTNCTLFADIHSIFELKYDTASWRAPFSLTCSSVWTDGAVIEDPIGYAMSVSPDPDLPL